MRSLFSRAIQADTSFSIGLGLIVLLAVAEISAATFYYIGRARAARESAQAVAAPLVRRAAPATSTPLAPAPAEPAQVPEASAPTPPPSLVDQLLREGIELRERGDTTTALARLQEASESDPTNAAVLEEMAKTYEAMQLFDRSNDIWRKLREMGPSAGEAYELADRRLKLGVPTPAAEPGAASAPLDAAPPNKDVGGSIAEGSIFGITEVKTSETPDADAEKNLTLQIGIKKQPDATIDDTKVKIQVFFYDMVDNKDIKLTDAEVNYEWLTPKHDWKETNPEILSVNYLRPKTKIVSPEAALSEAAASVKPGQKGRPARVSTGEPGQRKYLGYKILLYYDDKLQAVQAEPARLLQLFPPSEKISPP